MSTVGLAILILGAVTIMWVLGMATGFHLGRLKASHDYERKLRVAEEQAKTEAMWINFLQSLTGGQNER